MKYNLTFLYGLKGLKPQHFNPNSIKTRTVNINNNFYPPLYYDGIILTMNKKPKKINYTFTTASITQERWFFFFQ